MGHTSPYGLDRRGKCSWAGWDSEQDSERKTWVRFTHPIHSFSSHSLSTYYVLGVLLDTGSNHSLFPLSLSRGWGAAISTGSLSPASPTLPRPPLFRSVCLNGFNPSKCAQLSEECHKQFTRSHGPGCSSSPDETDGIRASVLFHQPLSPYTKAFAFSLVQVGPGATCLV